jgi:hypothetical protein
MDNSFATRPRGCLGSEVLVRLLLDRGADINAQGGFYGNALQAAAFSGSAVVCLLETVKKPETSWRNSQVDALEFFVALLRHTELSLTTAS